MPLHVHVKENPKNFRRFDVFWTPTVLVVDPEGKERWRLEGYLPKNEFQAHLEMGLARVALARKDWGEAESRYGALADSYPESKYAPQAVYYRGVSKYSASHNGADLAATADALKKNYEGSEWQLRSLPWLDE